MSWIQHGKAGRRKRVSTRWGIAVSFALAALAAGSTYVWLAFRAPAAIAVRAEAPSVVSSGELSTLWIVVENLSDTDKVRITDIDIGDSYLRGFDVFPRGSDVGAVQRADFARLRTYRFNREIPPGGQERFEFRLWARRGGEHRGEVTVFDGAKTATATLSTRVEGKDQPGRLLGGILFGGGMGPGDGGTSRTQVSTPGT